MVTISEKAQQKIGELLEEEKDAIGLRVYVKGGGCHGYQYGMSFETKTGDEDTIIEEGGVKVILDSQSAPLLSGAEVDYVDSVQGSGFAIKNPQAKTTCGCGSSFSAESSLCKGRHSRGGVRSERPHAIPSILPSPQHPARTATPHHCSAP